MAEYFGEFGGEVLRDFTANVDGQPKEYSRGDVIPSADTKGWSFVVRKVLATSGQVRWFSSKYEEVQDTIEVDELKETIAKKDKEIAELKSKLAEVTKKPKKD